MKEEKDRKDFPGNKGRKKGRLLIRSAVLLLWILGLAAVFSLIEPRFASVDNVITVIASAMPYAAAALGMTFALAAGGTDLSSGAVAFACVTCGGALARHGMALWCTVPFMLALGALLGLVNGYLTADGRLMSWSVTLGTAMLLRGLCAVLLPGESLNYYADDRLTMLLASWNGLPTALPWVLGMALLAALLLRRTRTGRYILAVGTGEEAARLAGIDTAKARRRAFVLSGLFAGAAAVLMCAAGNGTAAAGIGFAPEALAGAVFGGGSMIGTVLGCILTSTVRSGIQFVSGRSNVQADADAVRWAVTGGALLAALCVCRIRVRRAEKRAGERTLP